MGFQFVLVAFFAELMSANRKLLEDARFNVLKLADAKRNIRLSWLMVII